ncbi:bifunctional adenosylcobinamide kinase/adenosylcobinamide-phosphate guanylyltransferase [Yoonia litorea]|uniref:Bifunctional adenosylcobalamin biosynthesis protein n=1 Tax=Yoonia litorea TaxID=1123755 RepID=A0A1I6L829_9RHOB|nr:bifunctional adenosylcobinamide kinase/adenosylcobinamide-phosphate guanylyltransferase [Yoonia litorea]SFR99577.1 adenosylcobinamide kinase /adenosylcobinamide-phosphate guanylyltransferase [Yoonia litorea]
MTLPRLTLVLGGAASGKSAFAESLLRSAHPCPTYIATAQAFDAEMAAKVAAHKSARGPDWTTIEEPVDLAHALLKAPDGAPVLIDCATLWLTNVILGEHDLETAQSSFVTALSQDGRAIVIVSNETGQGVVPDNALARRFRNAQGRLNQEIAAKADLVVAVMAGLPLVLKGQLP